MLESVISWIMLGVLLVLLLFLGVGAGFGALRGGKRATLRLGIITIALIVALLMTPLFSRAAINMTIPGLGQSAGGAIEEFIVGSDLGAAIAADVPDIVTFAQACAVVLVNFVMFFILFFSFKFLSWIVYAVIAMRFFPTKIKEPAAGKKPRKSPSTYHDKNGVLRVKRHRWWGVGVGAATGLVVFTFFMIPILGTMNTIDRAARYQPTFASFNSKEADSVSEDGLAGFIMDAYDLTNDINSQIQNSAMGRITKYTGIQGVGGWGVSYLANVRLGKNESGVTRVNLRNDLVKSVHVVKDGAAIAVELSRDGSLVDRMENWTSSDYRALQNMVDNIFEIDLVRMLFGYTEVLVDVLEREGTFDDTITGLGSGDGFAAQDPEFTPAVYEVIRTFTRPSQLRSDLKNLIEMARLLFAKGDVNAGFYYDIRDIIDSANNVEVATQKAEALATKLERVHRGSNNAERLMKTFFDMSLVRAVFDIEGLSSLYRVPLADALELESEKVVFVTGEMTNARWDQVSRDAGQLLINVIRSVSCIVAVANGEGNVEDRIQQMDITSLAAVLDTLTNSQGIGTFMRAVIVKQLDDADLGEMGDFDTGSIIKTLQDKLESGKHIDWMAELELIRSMAVFIAGLGDLGNLTPADLADLLKNIGNSLLGDVVLDLVNDMLEDTGIRFDVPSEHIGEFFYILGDAAGTLVELFTGDGELDPENAEDLVQMLSGSDGILTQLADLNDLITADGGDPIQIDLSGLTDGEVDQESIKAALEEMVDEDGGQMYNSADILRIMNLFTF